MKHQRYLLLIVTLFLFAQCKKQNKDYITLTDWKFKTGDNSDWSKPAFDDKSWKTVQSNMLWENQGFADYNGVAWYRIKFTLPESLKEKALYKDTIQIALGKIDDTDETFLNGEFIGTNNHLTNPIDAAKYQKNTAYNVFRTYKIPATDSRLKWGQENVLAIKVIDTGGGGGLYEGETSIGFIGLKDYLKMSINANGLNTIDSTNYEGNIEIKNLAPFTDYSGKLIIKVLDTEKKKVVVKHEIPVDISAKSTFNTNYKIPRNLGKQYTAEYIFKESKSGNEISHKTDLPYILTPKAPSTPRINGPKVIAARPGKPILFKIPASGEKPIRYFADNKTLPKGLKLITESGIISGNIQKAGEYIIKLLVKNKLGKDTRDLKIVIGEKLCLTPPMGWNSWNCWGLSVTEEKMKKSIDAFIEKGLADYGWAYVNIDDGWEAPARKKDGTISTNEKFGSMKALSEYAHSKGLKLGIYSSPGPKTCGGYLGSYQHEFQDAKTYAEWGIDYLKYDWCSYGDIFPNAKTTEDYQLPYKTMQSALNKVNRDIVYSLCQYGMKEVWKWGDKVNGQLWRTTGDITDTWESLSGIGFSQENCAEYTKPGNWNDPDMLIVGWLGWGPQLHPTRLSANEQYTHISLWSLLSAPLLLGCDLSKLDDFTTNLLTNNEVIDIDQDILGKPAIFAVKDNKCRIIYKQLEDGSIAVGLFNLTKEEISVTANWSDLKISGKQIVRDVWRQKDLGNFSSKFDAKVAPHGVVLVKITKK